MKLPSPEHWINWKLNRRFLIAQQKNHRLFFHAFLVGIIAGGIGAIFRQALSELDN